MPYLSNINATSLSDTYPLILPDADGANGETLITDGAGNLSWGAGGGGGGSGDVVGTSSSLINEIPIYADTTGKLIGNSGIKLETITGTALAESVYLGYNVYPSVGLGYNETKLGSNIGKVSNSGDWNCMVGSNLATSLSSGSSNCIFGKQIATNLTTGSANTLMGDKVWSTFTSTALVPSGSQSTYNTYIGAVSGGNSTGTCYGRTSIGVLANCKYDHSIQLGNAYWESLPSIGAVKSCFLGDSLMMYRDNTTGSMVIGTTSVLPTITPALANAISIGDDNCTLPNQVSLGNSSAVDLKLGTRNVFKYLGTDSVSALGSVSNPATNVLGISIGLNTGTNLINNSSSVLIGGACDLAVSALQSVYIGSSAGQSNNGSNNVAVGCFALESATGVAHNTAIGEYSLNNAQTDYNTGLGSYAGSNITTGDGTFVGYNANVSVPNAGLIDLIAIGKNATADKNGQCMLGASTLTELVPHAFADANIGSATNPWNNAHLKGVINLTNTTQSTSTITGALLISGGVGIAKNVDVGGALQSEGILYVKDATDSTSKITGAVQIDGGVGIIKNLSVGANAQVEGITYLVNTTQSTSAITGALQVDGGVGILKDVFITGNLNVAGSISGQFAQTATKTASYTAVNNDEVLCDTNGAVGDITITLPATPSAGNQVRIVLITEHATRNVLIDRNGTNFMGTTNADAYLLCLNGDSITVKYMGGSVGWNVIVDGIKPHSSKIWKATTAQSLTINVLTNITFNTTTYDIGGIADLGNDRFNIRRSGKYSMSTELAFINMTAGKVIETFLWGTNYYVQNAVPSVVGTNFCAAHIVDNILAGENVGVRGRQNDATRDINYGQTGTFFSIAEIR